MKHQRPTSELEKRRPTFLLLGLCISLLAVYGLFELRIDKGTNRCILKPESTSRDIYQIPRTFNKQPAKPKAPVDVKKPNKKTFTEFFIHQIIWSH